MPRFARHVERHLLLDDVGGLPRDLLHALSRRRIEHPRRLVHRSRRHDCAVRVEGKADDLGRVAAVRMIEVSVVCVPQLARFVCAIARAAGV